VNLPPTPTGPIWLFDTDDNSPVVETLLTKENILNLALLDSTIPLLGRSRILTEENELVLTTFAHPAASVLICSRSFRLIPSADRIHPFFCE